MVTATRIEEWAARRVLPRARVVRVGIGQGFTTDDAAISCGLAGGLLDEVPTGTVLIPSEVLRPSGERLICDRQLLATFVAAARRLGYEPLTAPLVTSTAIVRGSARKIWADRGYAGVDMETGEIVAPRVVAVRVVLDTPQRELSWRAFLWLVREGPRCSQLAARVVAAGLNVF